MGDKKPKAFRSRQVREEEFSQSLGDLTWGLPPMNHETNIDVSDLNPPELLAALYNAARAAEPKAEGFVIENMTPAEARSILSEHGFNFVRFRGRVLNVKLGRMKLETDLYDVANGVGAGRRVLEALRAARYSSRHETYDKS